MSLHKSINGLVPLTNDETTRYLSHNQKGLSVSVDGIITPVVMSGSFLDINNHYTHVIRFTEIDDATGSWFPVRPSEHTWYMNPHYVQIAAMNVKNVTSLKTIQALQPDLPMPYDEGIPLSKVYWYKDRKTGEWSWLKR